MLTQTLETLTRLAEQPRIDDRGALAAVLTDLCSDKVEQLTGAEAAMAFEILHLLIDRIETKLRQRIAHILAARDDVPRSLIQFLANDEISVAYPVLIHSSVLQDEDLIAVLVGRSQDHHLAIAIRPGLSEVVSDQLIRTQDAETVSTLLCNETARIFPGSLAALAEQSASTERYREPLLRRRDLPDALAHRMHAWVGAALQAYIVENFTVDPDAVEGAMATALSEIEEIGEAARTGDRTPINPPSGHGLVEQLRRGNVTGFEARFAELLDLPLKAAASILYDGRPEALAIACKAGGFDRSVLKHILLTLSGRTPDKTHSPMQAVKRAISYFDNLAFASASAMLESWRRSPEGVCPG